MVTKSIGSKLAPFLNQIVPLLLSIMTKLDDSSSVDIDNELSEACLSTLQSIIRRCPKEVEPYIKDTIESALNLLSYDPNYVYNDDEEEMQDEEDAEGWDGSDFEDEEEDQADNDDDSSWKVRRGAISVLEAVVKTRPDFLKIIIKSHSLNLVDRFKERVDDVKCNLLSMFESLLVQSTKTMPESIDTELAHKTSLQRKDSVGGMVTDMSAPIVKGLVK